MTFTAAIAILFGRPVSRQGFIAITAARLVNQIRRCDRDTPHRLLALVQHAFPPDLGVEAVKRGTPDHPKVYELCEVLEIKRPIAIGYLELLWHFTATYAPAGDIGRFPDKRIEAALDWNGRIGRLIEALISSRWIDVSGAHRLIVHDWHDHADEAVKKRLQRAGIGFASESTQGQLGVNLGSSEGHDPGQNPSWPSSDPELSENDLPSAKALNEQNLAISAKVSRQHLDTIEPRARALPVPEPVPEPDNTPPSASPKVNEIDRWFDTEFWRIYPRRVKKAEAKRAAQKVAREPRTRQAIMAGLRDQLPGFAAKEPWFIPHPSSWLNGRRWEDEPDPMPGAVQTRNGTLPSDSSETLLEATSRREQQEREQMLAQGRIQNADGKWVRPS